MLSVRRRRLERAVELCEEEEPGASGPHCTGERNFCYSSRTKGRKHFLSSLD